MCQISYFCIIFIIFINKLKSVTSQHQPPILQGTHTYFKFFPFTFSDNGFNIWKKKMIFALELSAIRQINIINEEMKYEIKIQVNKDR